MNEVMVPGTGRPIAIGLKWAKYSVFKELYAADLDGSGPEGCLSGLGLFLLLADQD
jgi:hypothetical protein